jgi:hypothetical protein
MMSGSSLARGRAGAQPASDRADRSRSAAAAKMPEHFSIRKDETSGLIKPME